MLHEYMCNGNDSPHTLQSSSHPLPELELETTVAASHARRTCSQKPLKETGKCAHRFRFNYVIVIALAPASFSDLSPLSPTLIHFLLLSPKFDTKVEKIFPDLLSDLIQTITKWESLTLRLENLQKGSSP
jgi:hypothetical protein